MFIKVLVIGIHYNWTRASFAAHWWICLQFRRPGFNPWLGKIPWRREWLSTPVFWPGEFHGLYSPWGCKESDTTERVSLSVFHNWTRLSNVALILWYKALSDLSWCARNLSSWWRDGKDGVVSNVPNYYKSEVHGLWPSFYWSRTANRVESLGWESILVSYLVEKEKPWSSELFSSIIF